MSTSTRGTAKKSSKRLKPHGDPALASEASSVRNLGDIEIIGGVWSASTPSAQPEITLSNWRVSEVTVSGRRERHVWGWNVADWEGRASTAITEVDAHRRMMRTASGRVYRLAGPPGHDRDGDFVWRGWCRVNGATDEIDVTDEIAARLTSKP